ncbi:GLD2 polymerase, partial [Eubucco bourcierii]|nr:GLD2 polymerase [Eubucco bourcierii]
MFPNSSNLGHSPFSPNHQQSNFFNKIPLNIPSALLSHQQITNAHLSFQNAVSLLNGNLATVAPVIPQPVTYRNGSPACTSDAPILFRGRKRPSEESVPQNVKQQCLHSHYSETTVVNHAVPLQEKRRYSFPEPVKSPLSHAPPLQGILLPYCRETTLPVGKDKLSQQILEWFQVCQQQICDVNRKELCRIQLQREIKKIFPRSRLFLVGSTLNGFGTHNSDGDLCLLLKEDPINQRTEARYILSLIQKHFATRLSSYIERPQLIQAKVPIVKFRDKSYRLGCMEFDLNVNNVVGIRNTFLLRTYSCIENRVRPLVVIVKKWASFHEINDASRGTLNSYSLVLMVLHYLQTPQYPSYSEDPELSTILKESFDPAMQLNLVHRTPHTIPPYISMNGSSLGDLLIGFFKYYATEFDWSRQMISVREAKAMPRPDGAEWRNKFICIE